MQNRGEKGKEKIEEINLNDVYARPSKKLRGDVYAAPNKLLNHSSELVEVKEEEQQQPLYSPIVVARQTKVDTEDNKSAISAEEIRQYYVAVDPNRNRHRHEPIQEAEEIQQSYVAVDPNRNRVQTTDDELPSFTDIKHKYGFNRKKEITIIGDYSLLHDPNKQKKVNLPSKRRKTVAANIGLGTLARGGFGKVKHARKKDDEKRYVSKRIKPEFTTNQKQFIESAKIEKRFHEYIASFQRRGSMSLLLLATDMHLVNTKKGVRLYQFMPLASFGNGEKLIKLLPKLDNEDKNKVVMHCARSLVSAVYEMHINRVYHCDIKPDNMIIDIDEQGDPICYLSDFNLSRALGLRGEEIIPPAAGNMLNCIYAPPERLDDQETIKLTGRELYRKNDQWQLGVTLLELACPNEEDREFIKKNIVKDYIWHINTRAPDQISHYKKIKPEIEKRLQNVDPILSKVILGLLEPEHEKRMTLEAAMALLMPQKSNKDDRNKEINNAYKESALIFKKMMQPSMPSRRARSLSGSGASTITKEKPRRLSIDETFESSSTASQGPSGTSGDSVSEQGSSSAGTANEESDRIITSDVPSSTTPSRTGSSFEGPSRSGSSADLGSDNEKENWNVKSPGGRSRRTQYNFFQAGHRVPANPIITTVRPPGQSRANSIPDPLTMSASGDLERHRGFGDSEPPFQPPQPRVGWFRRMGRAVVTYGKTVGSLTKRHWGKMLFFGVLAAVIIAGVIALPFTFGSSGAVVAAAIGTGVVAGASIFGVSVGATAATVIGSTALGLAAAAAGIVFGATIGAVLDGIKAWRARKQSAHRGSSQGRIRPLMRETQTSGTSLASSPAPTAVKKHESRPASSQSSGGTTKTVDMEEIPDVQEENDKGKEKVEQDDLALTATNSKEEITSESDIEDEGLIFEEEPEEGNVSSPAPGRSRQSDD